MHDHLKHVKGGHGAYSQYNTPLVPESDRVASTSGGGGKASVGNLPSPTSDDDDEKQVNSDLLNAWMQRLQILTVVTTFLASTDGELFSLTALNTQIGLPTGTTSRELVYSCLSGALILHICACILGYVASFALIRYRIVESSGEDDTKVGGILSPGLGIAQPAQRISRRIILEPVRPLRWVATFVQRPERFRFLSASRSSRPSPPPLSLLTHCYYTTLCLTAMGSILALTGILAYVWAGLPMPVGIFSTICLGVGVSAGMWAITM